MLWYPLTLVFIFHGHVAVQMRDSQLLYAKDTDQLRQECMSGECPAQPLLKAQAAAAGCSEQCPAGFSVSQSLGTLQAHQSVCARVCPASPQESFFSPYITFYCSGHRPACGRCVLSLVWESGTAQVPQRSAYRC